MLQSSARWQQQRFVRGQPSEDDEQVFGWKLQSQAASTPPSAPSEPSEPSGMVWAWLEQRSQHRCRQCHPCQLKTQPLLESALTLEHQSALASDCWSADKPVSSSV